MSETVSVCKRFEISYAHHLQDYPGKCEHLHGHNAIVELEFTEHIFICGEFHSNGKHKAASGMVHDFTEIKNEAERRIKDTLDHKCLNDIFQSRQRPTAENLCVFIANLIFNDTPFANLTRVRVWEDRDSYAEWRR